MLLAHLEPLICEQFFEHFGLILVYSRDYPAFVPGCIPQRYQISQDLERQVRSHEVKRLVHESTGFTLHYLNRGTEIIGLHVSHRSADGRTILVYGHDAFHSKIRSSQSQDARPCPQIEKRLNVMNVHCFC